MFDVSGKVVIVTGGNKGIGEAIAKTFAKEGSKVAIWGRNVKDNEKVTADIIAAGGQAVCMQCDVSDEQSVDAALKATLEVYGGRVDVFVNSAGIMIHGDETQVPPESIDGFRKVLDVNLVGPYIGAKAVFPIMRKQHYGRIILIASMVHSRISVGRVLSYTASKSGEVGLVRHLAMEGGAWGITVNAVCPGGTLTPMLKAMSTPESLAERERLIPTGRLATPQDQANLTVFLASDEAEQITGQAITVDGGQIIPWMERDQYFKNVTDLD